MLLNSQSSRWRFERSFLSQEIKIPSIIRVTDKTIIKKVVYPCIYTLFSSRWRSRQSSRISCSSCSRRGRSEDDSSFRWPHPKHSQTQGNVKSHSNAFDHILRRIDWIYDRLFIRIHYHHLSRWRGRLGGHISGSSRSRRSGSEDDRAAGLAAVLKRGFNVKFSVILVRSKVAEWAFFYAQ